MTLRIAFTLSATGPSGGAKILLEHARRLAARGHETVLVVPSGREPPRWLDHGRPVLRAIPAGQDLVVATRYRDVPRAIAGARGAALVHLVQGDDTAGPRAVLERSGGGLRAAVLRYRARRKLRRVAAALSAGTAKLAVSRALAGRLRARGISARVIPNGVDETVFVPRPPRAAAAVARVLVSGPRHGPTKGLSSAFLVLARARAQRSLVTVHLSPDAVSAAPEADERLAGLPEPQVAELLSHVDLFLSLTTEDEGFDLPALEALASGVVCVLSDTAVHREILGGTEAALLVPPCDAGAVADAVVRALTDDVLRSKLSAGACEVGGRYAWSLVLPEVERAYEEVARGA